MYQITLPGGEGGGGGGGSGGSMEYLEVPSFLGMLPGDVAPRLPRDGGKYSVVCVGSGLALDQEFLCTPSETDAQRYIIALHDNVCGVWTMQRVSSMTYFAMDMGPKEGDILHCRGTDPSDGRRDHDNGRRLHWSIVPAAADGSFYIRSLENSSYLHGKTPEAANDQVAARTSLTEGDDGFLWKFTGDERPTLDGTWDYVRSEGEWTGTDNWGSHAVFDGMKGRYTMTDGYSYGDFELVSNAPNDIRGTDRRDNGWHSPMSGAIQADGLLRIESGNSTGWYRRTGGGCDAGGGPRALDALVVSKSPDCAKLVEILIAASPGLASSAIVIAACAKPPRSELALKLLDTYPTVMLDAAAVAPLLADNKKLRALVLGEEATCRQLVDALLARSAALKDAASAVAS